jgi:hypothetical protein
LCIIARRTSLFSEKQANLIREVKSNNAIMKSLTAFCWITLLASFGARAQVVNTATMDTTTFRHKGSVTVEGYIDLYYAYNFNNPAGKDQPYFVSMARDKEVNINLAYVDVKYIASRVRARFVPGFGTYINANYVNEPGSLKHIVEGSIGIRVAPNRNIWIDAGVFGSPYTNESAISKDHLAYTRSFAPEYVPYYLSGVKLTMPISNKVNAYLYVLNGWQQIQDKNDNLSVGTQLEFRPSDNLLINWDSYIGNERSASDALVGTRYFTDLYFIYGKDRFSATSCVYIGMQPQSGASGAVWWQANFIARYNLTKALSVTGRIEYFSDPHSVQVVPITTVNGFSTSSSSLGLNYQLAENVLLRLEGRTFFSSQDVYMRNNQEVATMNSVTGNVTVWF